MDLLIQNFSLVPSRSTRTLRSHHNTGGPINGFVLVRSSVGRGARSSGQCTGTPNQQTSLRVLWELAGELDEVVLCDVYSDVVGF